jgi:hypothetical protein
MTTMTAISPMTTNVLSMAKIQPMAVKPSQTARIAPRIVQIIRLMHPVCAADGVLSGPGQADTFYEALSRERVEVAPVLFEGTGYLRVAAAPYNTPDDYDRLADAVRELLKRW